MGIQCVCVCSHQVQVVEQVIHGDVIVVLLGGGAFVSGLLQVAGSRILEAVHKVHVK